MKNGLIIDKYGTKHWFLNDKYHRVDGPAIEWPAGGKWWFLNGNRLSEEEWYETMTNILLNKI